MPGLRLRVCRRNRSCRSGDRVGFGDGCHGSTPTPEFGLVGRAGPARQRPSDSRFLTRSDDTEGCCETGELGFPFECYVRSSSAFDRRPFCVFGDDRCIMSGAGGHMAKARRGHACGAGGGSCGRLIFLALRRRRCGLNRGRGSPLIGLDARARPPNEEHAGEAEGAGRGCSHHRRASDARRVQRPPRATVLNRRKARRRGRDPGSCDCRATAPVSDWVLAGGDLAVTWARNRIFDTADVIGRPSRCTVSRNRVTYHRAGRRIELVCSMRARWS